MTTETPNIHRGGKLYNAKSMRNCIIVAGMHRSGTSATTRLLNLLGCDISTSLMSADKFNERGYWESRSVTDLNDQILVSAGLVWDDWQPLRKEWFSSPKAAEFEERAADLLRQEFGHSHLFVIKDPRLCRTLPVWIKAMEGCKIIPMIVSPVRAPPEVAKSLAKRNGMNGAIAQLLWLQYTLDAEFHSRHLSRSYVSYETVLSDWRHAAKQMGVDLDLSWPRQSSTVEIEIDRFLDPSLRHHKAQDKDPATAPEFSSWVHRTAQILEQMADGGDQAAHWAELDVIRGEFEKASSNFARPLLEHQFHGRWLASRLETVETDVRSTQTELAALTSVRDTLSSEREALSARAEAQEQRLSEVWLEKSALEAEKRDLIAALADAKTSLNEKLGRAAAQEQELDEISAALAAARTAHAAASAESSAIAEMLSKTQALLESQTREASAQLATLTLERDALTASAEVQDRRLSEVRLEISALEEQKRDLAAALAEANASLAEKKVHVEAQQQELEQKTVALEAAQAAQTAALAESSAIAEMLSKAQALLEVQTQEASARASRSESIIQEYSKELSSFKEIIASKDLRIQQSNEEMLEFKARSETHAARATLHEKCYEETLAELNSVRREINARNSELADYDRDVLAACERADRLEAELTQVQSLADQLTHELDRTQSSLREARSQAEAISAFTVEKDALIGRLTHHNASLLDDLSKLQTSATEYAEALAVAKREAEDAIASISETSVSFAKSKQETSRSELLRREAAKSLQLRNQEFDNAVAYIRRLEDHIANIEKNSDVRTRSMISVQPLAYQEGWSGAGRATQMVPVGQVIIDDHALSEFMAQIERLHSIEGSTTWKATRVLRSWVARHEGVKKIIHSFAVMMARIINRNRLP